HRSRDRPRPSVRLAERASWRSRRRWRRRSCRGTRGRRRRSRGRRPWTARGATAARGRRRPPRGTSGGPSRSARPRFPRRPPDGRHPRRTGGRQRGLRESSWSDLPWWFLSLVDGDCGRAGSAARGRCRGPCAARGTERARGQAAPAGGSWAARPGRETAARSPPAESSRRVRLATSRSRASVKASLAVEKASALRSLVLKASEEARRASLRVSWSVSSRSMVTRTRSAMSVSSPVERWDLPPRPRGGGARRHGGRHGKSGSPVVGIDEKGVVMLLAVASQELERLEAAIGAETLGDEREGRDEVLGQGALGEVFERVVLHGDGLDVKQIAGDRDRAEEPLPGHGVADLL